MRLSLVFSGTSLTVLLRSLALVPLAVLLVPLWIVLYILLLSGLSSLRTLTDEYDPRPRDPTVPAFFCMDVSIHHAGAQRQHCACLPGHPTVKHTILQVIPRPLLHELVHVPTTLGEGALPVEGPSTLIVS